MAVVLVHPSVYAYIFRDCMTSYMAKLEAAAEVVRRHPEVRRVILEWVRPFGAICRCGTSMSSAPDDFIVEYAGECFDWDRCVCGNNRTAASQLSGCDCWDGLITEENISELTSGGTLRLRHVEPWEGNPGLSRYVPPSVGSVQARILRRAGMPEVPEELDFYRRWCE